MSISAILRRLVIALVVFGLSANSMAYAMPAATGQLVVAGGQSQDVGMPCGMTMTAMDGADAAAPKSKMPCNTITPDCVKKMVCLQTVALPERGDLNVGPAIFATVSYRVSVSLLSGLTIEPELSPPLAA